MAVAVDEAVEEEEVIELNNLEMLFSSIGADHPSVQLSSSTWSDVATERLSVMRVGTFWFILDLWTDSYGGSIYV